MSQSSKWRFTPHVVVFSFIALTLIMITFITVAFKTYSGLWTNNSYEKGLDFAQINKDSLPGKAYPFNTRIDFDGSKFHVAYLGFNSSYIKDIQSYLLQPTNSAKDEIITFDNLYENGMISSPVKLNAGIWELRVQITMVDNEKYHYAKKFVVN